MLGFDPLRLANVGLAGSQVMPPGIAASNHVAGAAGTLENDHVLDRLATTQRDAFIDSWLERDLLATTALLIGRNHGNGAGIVDAVAYRLGGEAAENHRVNCADTGTRLHGDDAFNAHRHVDDNAVALLDAARTQAVGKLADLGQQRLVGDLCYGAVVGFKNQRNLVAQAGFDVAIQTVVGNVELAVGKPLEERRVGLIEPLRERNLPAHMFTCQTGPEALVILVGFRTQRLVSIHAGNRGLLDEFGGRLNKLYGFILGHRPSPVQCSRILQMI